MAKHVLAFHCTYRLVNVVIKDAYTNKIINAFFYYDLIDALWDFPLDIGDIILNG